MAVALLLLFIAAINLIIDQQYTVCMFSNTSSLVAMDLALAIHCCGIIMSIVATVKLQIQCTPFVICIPCS